MPRLARSHDALAELVAKGPSSEAPQMVRELLAAEKRISSLTAFVPFIGPWLIERSEAHSKSEKRKLTWASILLTALALGVLINMIPTPTEQTSQLQQRIESDMKRLDEFAEQYRSERGNYPDAAAWHHLAARADPRFYDPWARPYRYDVTGTQITLGTLGRDGVEGGADEDADVSASFPKAGLTR